MLYAFGVDAWTRALVEAAPHHADAVERYDALPGLFLAETSEQGARSIAQLPGVRSVRAASVAVRRIVWSINEQVMLAVTHRRELWVNGVASAADELLRPGVAAYPTLRLVEGAPRWGTDSFLELPTRLCFVSALNLSVESDRRIPYDAEDPIVLASRDAATELPVVFAAGNAAPGEADRTMHGWALSPSVIAVGATTDTQGTSVAAYSRTGDSSGARPGPTVVACGVDETGEVGTSYAAPVVSTQLALLAGMALIVRVAASRLSRGSTVEGAPLTGRCFVDIDLVGTASRHGLQVADFHSRDQHLPALPLDGVDLDVLQAASEHMSTEEARAISALPSPAALRRLLIASARPVPGSSPSQSGAGFVSLETTQRFLSTLDCAGFVRCLTGAEQGDTPPGPPLFDRSVLPELLLGIRASMLGWGNDLIAFSDGPDSPAPVFVEEPDQPQRRDLHRRETP